MVRNVTTSIGGDGGVDRAKTNKVRDGCETAASVREENRLKSNQYAGTLMGVYSVKCIHYQRAVGSINTVLSNVNMSLHAARHQACAVLSVFKVVTDPVQKALFVYFHGCTYLCRDVCVFRGGVYNNTGTMSVCSPQN